MSAMLRWTRLGRLSVGLWALAVTGCGSVGPAPLTAESPEGVPQPLAIRLKVNQTDGRLAYYELTPEGVLKFGGGIDARRSSASAVGDVPDKERARLWQIVDEHDLLDADGVPFASARETEYRVDLRVGDRHVSYRSVDERTKGLAALAKALANIRARLQADAIYEPIQRRIEASGGAVDKR